MNDTDFRLLRMNELELRAVLMVMNAREPALVKAVIEETAEAIMEAQAGYARG